MNDGTLSVIAKAHALSLATEAGTGDATATATINGGIAQFVQGG